MLPDTAFRKAVRNPGKIPRYIKWKSAKVYDKYLWNAPYATNIYDLDWEVCIILDACRVDLAEQATERLDWLPSPTTMWSVGGESRSWYLETTRGAAKNQLQNTSLVTGNPHSTAVKDIQWQDFVEVWRYGFDKSLGTIPPRPVTDRAINLYRNKNPNRLLVHYMQPHLPPVHTTDHNISSIDIEGEWTDPWGQVAQGELELHEVRPLYEENVYPVLEDIKLLLENIDADSAMVTADHGNYIGENGKWSHGAHHRGEVIRKVPLWWSSGKDERTHEPEPVPESVTDTAREEQLRALGYK